ncbi:MAG TPA: hypothetical protein PLU99_14820 [Phycisphaerae bacterium]|nr:hypothetical protein [Phycisphaerae bacterium]HRT43359.1 hypothetical protein [Phycisphaerae bacterium]
MSAERISEFLERYPFQPFRIRFANEAPVDVYNPALVVLKQRELFVANWTRDYFHLYWLTDVVEIEALHAA